MSYCFFLLLAGVVGIASVVFQILAGEEKKFFTTLNKTAVEKEDTTVNSETTPENNEP